MPYLPCDQFAADGLAVRHAIEARTGITVQLNITRIEVMVGLVEKIRDEGVITDHQEIAGIVLGLDTFKDDLEYSAYELWLEKIFERRLQAQTA